VIFKRSEVEGRERKLVRDRQRIGGTTMDPTKSSRRKGVARHPVAPQPSDAVDKTPVTVG
jgi:hypothetical protein